MNTEEGNKLIAEFMGAEILIAESGVGVYRFYDDEGTVCEAGSTDRLDYDSSWDWLMPVVEKIESIYDDFHGYFGVYISSNTCTIQGTKLKTDPENFHPAYLSDPNAILNSKIESTLYNVIKFIEWYKWYKWYNEQK